MPTDRLREREREEVPTDRLRERERVEGAH